MPTPKECKEYLARLDADTSVNNIRVITREIGGSRGTTTNWTEIRKAIQVLLKTIAAGGTQDE